MRVSRALPLVIVTSIVLACTSTDPIEAPASMAVVVVARVEQWGEALDAKEERRNKRESYRSLGVRVCEEGEWPQRWVEKSCRVCGCDEGEVRWCTMKGCWDREAASQAP